MSKILAVLGATGRQGAALIDYVLNDPELSSKYKIRAITRHVDSEKSKQLKVKVDVVLGDVTDRVSLGKALAGAHFVFSMTTPSLAPNALEVEYNIGKTVADVAVEQGAEYIIFSTLPPTKDISRGRYALVTPFDAKAKVEEYIRGLPIKSAFYSPGFFMDNFTSQPFLAPKQEPDGTWALARHISPKTKCPFIDAIKNTGNFVGAILAEPDQYNGKTFCAAQAQYTLEEQAAIISKTTGKTVAYKRISAEEFKNSLPVMAELFTEAFSALEEFGYWGPHSEEMVTWAIENSRGTLSTLEEYFQENPLQLV
ncbi:uncharacterized protein A1O9_09245 [Exophiala aquamarina CBS 119918]|uniref:NmrA-like domain-containing protein n=1 Tax=Exophiala aquamarina CBS 119918 TaxID=1182545 RepID=A0A072P6C1_9EURO|nr:uncharacterized protein A1O9_09245 [Exophiala aquamarina CBS 119918]KEF54803.1 hypothetical protein A1O9_09245 [Exophiala aquamarina CBS 119918]